MAFTYTNSEQMLTEIKKLLLDEHVTQRNLADRLEIKPQGLTKLLNKKTFPSKMLSVFSLLTMKAWSP